VKYEASLLGWLWSLLEPLLFVVVLWFLFTQVIVRGRTQGLDYGLFLAAGYLPWMWFQGCLNEGTRALLGESRVISTMQVPREIFPVALVARKLSEYVLSLPVLAIFAFAYRVPPHNMALLLLAVALQVILCLGVTMFLSVVTVMLRDIQRMIRIVSRLFFYASPVLYPKDWVPQRFQVYFELNPLVGILDLYRAVWFPEMLPSARPVLLSAGVSIVVFLVGFTTFRRLEPTVLKEL
jgi:ABC-2 type transport system permease protein